MTRSPFASSRGIRQVSSIEEVMKYAPSVFATHPAPNVSSKYHFVNTREVVDAIIETGWKLSGVQENRVRPDSKNFGFQRHVLRFRAVGSDSKPIVVGDVAPELVLMNSHDAGTSYFFAGGLFRFICTNGLVVADSTFANLRVRHSSKELDGIIESSRRILEGVPSILSRVDVMRNRMMTDEERKEFALNALRLRFDEERVSLRNAEALLVPVRREDSGSDLWSTMNVAQENLTHGFMAEDQNFRMRKVRPVTGVRPAFDLNRGLWNLADGFLKN